MPIVTRTGNSVNVNLTIPFLIWTAIWVVVAALTGVWGLLWVAALPWLFMLGFMVLAFIVGLSAMGMAYRPRKGTRIERGVRR